MINTVTGPINKEQLGPTLSHEHIAWEYIDSWNLYFHKIYDEDRVNKLYNIMIPLFKDLYNLGLRTIVEASPPRGGQNLMLMYRLSKDSGINIIPNTGMPFSKRVYSIHKNFDETELANRWISDYNNGLDTINGVVIKPAQIKLLLGDDGFNEIDRKILKGALMASKETNMPIHCHLLKATDALTVIDILEEENFDTSKFLWAHACNEANFDVIDKAYKKGLWIGFDQVRPSEYPKYLSIIKKAIDKGYKDKILLSQDFDFLEEFNKGEILNCSKFYTEFLDYCDQSGLSKDIIIEIISNNPARYLNID